MNANPSSPRNLLERSRSGNIASATGLDDDQDYTAFAHGRIGNRPQLTLVFRKADGSLRAFTYAHLFSVKADDPKTGFVLDFSGQSVTVSGRNLDELVRAVCYHKASEIIEAQRSQLMEATADAALISSIHFSGR